MNFFEYLANTPAAKVNADLHGAQASADQRFLDRYGIKNPAAPVKAISTPASQMQPKDISKEFGEHFENLKQAYVNALNIPGLNPQIIALLERQMMEQQSPEMIEVEPEPSIYDRILRHFDDSEE